MGTVYQTILPGDEGTRGGDTNKPGYREYQGTNLVVPCIAFPDGADTQAFFELDLKLYGGGNITVDIVWFPDASTNTAHDVMFGAAVSVLTPDADNIDTVGDSFATEATVVDTVLGGTSRREHICSITISALDSAAAGDLAVLRLRRIPLNAADDMPTSAMVRLIRVSFSDGQPSFVSAKQQIATLCGFLADTPSTTRYLIIGAFGLSAQTDLEHASMIVNAAGTLRDLRILTQANSPDDAVVFTVVKNGADTAITATLAAAGTAASDLSHTVTVAAGDVIGIKAVTGASYTAQVTWFHVGLTLEFS